jgi:CheY-like chemotaxis protein
MAADRTAKEFKPDAVVLDIMLPDLDGFEVLRRLRGQAPDVPVLFLTAKDAVEDRVAGLTLGVDDYVTKQFSLEEVVAWLRALMRRSGVGVASRQEAVLAVGDLSLEAVPAAACLDVPPPLGQRGGGAGVSLPPPAPAPRPRTAVPLLACWDACIGNVRPSWRGPWCGARRRGPTGASGGSCRTAAST